MVWHTIAYYTTYSVMWGTFSRILQEKDECCATLRATPLITSGVLLLEGAPGNTPTEPINHATSHTPRPNRLINSG